MLKNTKVNSVLKIDPLRISPNYNPLKQLRQLLPQEPYKARNVYMHMLQEIQLFKLTEISNTVNVRLLADQLYKDKLSDIFPNQEKCKKVILKSYDVSMHNDTAWPTALFLSVVINASKAGHILTAANSECDPKSSKYIKNTIIKTGSVFLLDPFSIHSVMSVDKKKQQLILLQYELLFKSRQDALKAMARCSYSTVA